MQQPKSRHSQIRVSYTWCHITTLQHLTPLFSTQITLISSSTPPSPSSLSTLSLLMNNRQQRGKDKSGYHAGVGERGPGLRFGWGVRKLFLQTILLTLPQLGYTPIVLMDSTTVCQHNHRGNTFHFSFKIQVSIYVCFLLDATLCRMLSTTSQIMQDMK